MESSETDCHVAKLNLLELPSLGVAASLDFVRVRGKLETFVDVIQLILRSGPCEHDSFHYVTTAGQYASTMKQVCRRNKHTAGLLEVHYLVFD